jgi:hypothetical protein
MSVQPWGVEPAQQAALAQAVESHVRLGWRVESSPLPGQVVVVRGKRPNHILHLLLSVVTLGLWLPVWLLLAATSHETRAVLTVRPDGSVTNSATPTGPWWKDPSAVIPLVLLVLAIAFVLYLRA